MKADPRRRNGALSVAITSSVLALAPIALAGPDWDEGPTDAGSTLGTAQVININSSLNTISGKLTGTALVGGDFQDCFVVDISSPMNFSLTTAPGAGGPANFNPMMFLFRIDVFGGQSVAKAIMANNDIAPGNVQSGLGKETNDGSGATITQAGLYLIAISGFGSQPINAQGEFLFNQAFLQPGVIAGPATNPSGGYLLDGWSADGSAGTYVMTVSGISGVPAPGALSLLALGGLVGRRRQR